MCEALVVARNVTMGVNFPDDAGTGATWQMARGHFASDPMPDGFLWGDLEDPRHFATAAERRYALLRFPGVSRARIRKYLANQTDVLDPKQVIRGRLWQIQWNSLPNAVKTLLAATGVLTIGPGGDFTWAQVQTFVVNLATGLGDSDDLSG